MTTLAGGDSSKSPAEELLAKYVSNGATLNDKVFPPLRWAVPGIIPQGMGLFTGPPKAGKSWAALGIALAVSTGGAALGNVPTGQPRPVLLLALEDGEQRLQSRCRHLLEDGEPIPALLDYVTVAHPGTTTAIIEAWLVLHGDKAPLVVLDTLGKVMPPSTPGESAYQRDYRVGSQLKRLVDAHMGATLLVVHHTRKQAGDDWMDSTSGTNGLNGAADWTLNLSRDRNSDSGLFKVTGRDVIEAEYAVTNHDGNWILDGADLRAAASRAEQVKVTVNLGDDSMRIVEHLAKHPSGQSPAEIAKALKMDPAKVRTYLGRLLTGERITKSGRGIYSSVATVTSVAIDQGAYAESNTSNTSNNVFQLPIGPGRCTSCGFHTEKQGHSPDCEVTDE